MESKKKFKPGGRGHVCTLNIDNESTPRGAESSGGSQPSPEVVVYPETSTSPESV